MRYSASFVFNLVSIQFLTGHVDIVDVVGELLHFLISDGGVSEVRINAGWSGPG